MSLAIRAKSLSSASPIASGKSSPSPSYSGKSSPFSTIDDTKLLSPRKKLLEIKTNVALTSKPSTNDLNRTSKNLNTRDTKGSKSDIESTGLLPINENGNIESDNPRITWSDLVEQEEAQNQLHNSNPAAQEMGEEQNNVLMFDQYSQTYGFIDEYLTLQQWRDKYENNAGNDSASVQNEVIETAVSHTTNKLDEMENEFLTKNANQPSNLIQTTVNLSNSNEFNTVIDTEITTKSAKESNEKKVIQPEEKKIQTGDRIKYSNVINRIPLPAKTNSLPKSTPNRLNTTKSATGVSVKSATTSNTAANPIRKVALKTASILPTNKFKPVFQKDSYKDLNRRSAAPIRSNGAPTNTASRLAARSKTMMELGKNSSSNSNMLKSLSRDCDSMGSSTSTLRASNDHISNSHSKLNGRRSEPKTIPTRNEDDDGWLTVKTRRRSSLHWANRFNQPSGYASLPTLALLNEKDTSNAASKSINNNKKENKKVTKSLISKSIKVEVTKSSTVMSNTTNAVNSKLKTIPSNATIAESKLKTNEEQENSIKMIKSIESPTSSPSLIVSRATILQRQKSDVTGLKINNLRREYLRMEKIKSKQKDGTKSSAVAETVDQKVSMNIQTNMGLTTVMCNLYASCLGDAEKDIMKIDDTKQGTESDDKDEIESDENQRKLLEEQMCLERQILELQNTEIDVDTETDDADCETILGLEESDSNATEIDESCNNTLNLDEEEDLEAKYQHLLSDMSSGERIQTLATLQAFVSRHPGRAQELHQKLSSPSRRRSLHETLRKYQAKQERARDMRETLNKEKTLKLQALLARVEDVKTAKQKLIEEKRLRMEEKLQRYAENRNQYLKDKVRKAHDEEEKLKEIAFIKELEAQNKRLDLMELRKEQEGRLQDLEQERQKKMEEKAAKEAAVERRRLELAKERQKRLEKIDETRREREQRVEQKQEERDKLRQKIAREKVNFSGSINKSFFDIPYIVLNFIGTRSRRAITCFTSATTANNRRATAKNHSKATRIRS